MKKKILLFACIAVFAIKGQAQTVTDYDGNIYNTVVIGTQTWMRENLKVTHYRNGDLIPNVKSGTVWGTLTTGARCYYNNDSSTNSPVYGALYNWYTVNDIRKVCPTGWHVPGDGEWSKLEKYLDNTVDTTANAWIGTDIGDKLKESGTSHWSIGNGGTNSSNFTALPGGYHIGSAYSGIRNYGRWWTAREYDATNAWYRGLHYSDSATYKYFIFKANGISVRCLNDNSNDIKDINYLDQIIKLYPTPANDHVYIDYAGSQSLKIQVYNIIGGLVLQSELAGGTNEIDISSLTTGSYIIKISCADWTVQRKIIKE